MVCWGCVAYPCGCVRAPSTDGGAVSGDPERFLGGDLYKDGLMSFSTLNKIPLPELKAMADGSLADTITDMDFLETLAAQHCLVVPPWIMETRPDGSLSRLTRVVYTTDGELDKARMLLAVARQLRQHRNPPTFGPRFSV